MDEFIPVPGQMAFWGLVNGLPIWSQPGGIGTPVFPQQRMGEQVGMFVMPFCGHWTNSPDIRIMQWNPPSFIVGFRAPAAFVMCPLCSCVSRVIYPVAELYSQLSNYIVLP